MHKNAISFLHSPLNREQTSMKNITLYIALVTLLGFATSSLAESVTWESCSDDTPTVCEVHDVKVEPCREAASGRPCRIKRGRTASIAFDFTPDFAGGNLQTRAYWASEMGDLPFLGMNTNACDSTPCPASSGTRQTYNYTLAISDNYSPRIYDVKWKLWNAEEKQCCFVFQIKLTK